MPATVLMRLLVTKQLHEDFGERELTGKCYDGSLRDAMEQHAEKSRKPFVSFYRIDEHVSVEVYAPAV